MVHLLGIGAGTRETNAEGMLTGYWRYAILNKQHCAIYLTKPRVTMKTAPV